ncbi:PepSY domain-containing protein [Halovulum dunhuangense]|uniref:PepSY domain-containing protein n=1 Tax=Halovulum dunhuangense TaxID=1505036 RepID=A0A849L112_9RHOB|nr:PepSY domain-containing protein [Halovulum dunhuangense]NNU79978.1 PepSY domain-containing protein [Halovulum dunhuangense]
MKLNHALPAILVATAVAAPAMAEPDCAAAAASAQPMWNVVRSFEEAGGVVRTAKVTDEKCYEIYGTRNGRKVEIHFDPATGAELARKED